jgi:membrane protease YdiL (CAAX protease family)
MKKKPLIAYFIILIVLSSSFIVGARILGEQGVYLAQGYMLTPAIAAIITRLFFYPLRFKDANLRFGNLKDYFKFWALALGITALSFIFYTIFGAIEWDLSGSSFLVRLEEQFALSGGEMLASLPPGFTPELMLLVFTIGGLTLFNIMPGLISGFGEEFGHRGFMFPHLYRINPWVGLIGGGLIWYAWHLPLSLIISSQADMLLGISVLNHIILATGSVCTFTYLAYVYVKSGSVFVTAIAHIAMNNATMALSYYVIVRDEFLANIGTVLPMVIVVGILYLTKELRVLDRSGSVYSDEGVARLPQTQKPNLGQQEIS